MGCERCQTALIHFLYESIGSISIIFTYLTAKLKGQGANARNCCVCVRTKMGEDMTVRFFDC